MAKATSYILINTNTSKTIQNLTHLIVGSKKSFIAADSGIRAVDGIFKVTKDYYRRDTFRRPLSTRSTFSKTTSLLL